MSELERQAEGEIVSAAPMVWLIERGEYDDRHVVAVVQGSAADADRVAERWNATHSWRDGSAAYATGPVPFFDTIPTV